MRLGFLWINRGVVSLYILGKNGSGSYYNIAQGIYWAVDHGAKVINLSLGARFNLQTLHDAVCYAYKRGVVVMAASGNDGRVGENAVYYPAAFDYCVIAVGAVRFDKARSYYSNGENSLDLVAPGGDLGVDQNGDGYKDGILRQTFRERHPNREGFYFYQGTSMATAHVSAVAALLVARGISSPSAVRSTLQNSALDLGNNGWDREYGYGLIDSAAALGLGSIPTFSPVPTAIPTSTPTATPRPRQAPV